MEWTKWHTSYSKGDRLWAIPVKLPEGQVWLAADVEAGQHIGTAPSLEAAQLLCDNYISQVVVADLDAVSEAQAEEVSEGPAPEHKRGRPCNVWTLRIKRGKVIHAMGEDAAITLCNVNLTGKQTIEVKQQPNRVTCDGCKAALAAGTEQPKLELVG